MEIRTLTKDELLLLAAELGLEVNPKLRKPEIRRAIEGMDFEDGEIYSAWAKVCRVEKERVEERERQESKEKRQNKLKLEKINLNRQQ